jgi:hypothetical protein
MSASQVPLWYARKAGMSILLESAGRSEVTDLKLGSKILKIFLVSFLEWT